MKQSGVNLVINSVFVSVFLLCLGFVNSEMCITFKCVPGFVQKVNVSGNVMTCPDDQVCNLKPTTCTPCVDCSQIYKCDAKKSDLVLIDDMKLYCLDGFRCNSEYAMPCDPCVKMQCQEKQNFTCVSDRHIIVDNVLLSCKSGFVCNRDYLHPCYPCIGEVDFKFSKIVRFNST